MCAITKDEFIFLSRYHVGTVINSGNSEAGYSVEFLTLCA
ncbi:Uncharacterised protein [Yersinia intermedia]|nr:hypothetical protein CH53_326 [Yersinia intermedia]CNI65858.1 Uncharacterised protein [Yersinia intermedia]CQD99076.1 Uncharacterised protein [Yersinia intermedia]